MTEQHSTVVLEETAIQELASQPAWHAASSERCWLRAGSAGLQWYDQQVPRADCIAV